MDNYNIDDILSEVKNRKNSGTTPPQEPEKVEKKTEDNPFSISSEPTDKAEPIAPPAPPVNEEPAKDMVNLLSFAEGDGATADDYSDYIEPDPMDEIRAAKRKKRRKIIRNIIIIILVIAIIAGGGFGIYFWRAMQQIQEPSIKTEVEDNWSMDELVENYVPINEAEASEVASLEDMIKQWYYNGDPSSSTHVFNVLLIGTDTRGKEVKDEGTRADSAIICSVNIDTKTINLTSVLRDEWAYWEDEPGNPDTSHFNKINSAMKFGGIGAYVNAVERLYKVKIDNYVIVNFESFKNIIDLLGGITLELTSREIREINNHPKRYGNVTIEQTFSGTKGEVKLTGEQALAYCRIRKLDSDNYRANRQKTTLMKIVEMAKDAPLSTILKMVNAMIPYVKTDMSSKRIVKIAKYALSEGWLNYSIDTMNVPDAHIYEKGAGGTFKFTNYQWIWKPDYPADAYTVQMKIYGQSPITLAQNRVDVVHCRETGEFADGVSAVTDTIYNSHYGEATTIATTEKEKS